MNYIGGKGQKLTGCSMVIGIRNFFMGMRRREGEGIE